MKDYNFFSRFYFLFLAVICLSVFSVDVNSYSLDCTDNKVLMHLFEDDVCHERCFSPGLVESKKSIGFVEDSCPVELVYTFPWGVVKDYNQWGRDKKIDAWNDWKDLLANQSNESSFSWGKDIKEYFVQKWWYDSQFNNTTNQSEPPEPPPNQNNTTNNTINGTEIVYNYTINGSVVVLNSSTISIVIDPAISYQPVGPYEHNVYLKNKEENTSKNLYAGLCFDEIPESVELSYLDEKIYEQYSSFYCYGEYHIYANKSFTCIQNNETFHMSYDWLEPVGPNIMFNYYENITLESLVEIPNLEESFFGSRVCYHSTESINLSYGDELNFKLKYMPNVSDDSGKFDVISWVGDSWSCVYDGSCDSLYLVDPWWNRDFMFRFTANVQELSCVGNLTDFEVFKNVSYMYGMNSDFSDLRFTWVNNSTGLEQSIPYYIENKTDGEYADVWINVPEIRNCSNETVYMYFGNSQATSQSNPTNTFALYDSFDSFDTSKWTKIGAGSATVSGGVLNIVGVARVESNLEFGHDYWVTARSKYSPDSGGDSFGQVSGFGFYNVGDNATTLTVRDDPAALQLLYRSVRTNDFRTDGFTGVSATPLPYAEYGLIRNSSSGTTVTLVNGVIDTNLVLHSNDLNVSFGSASSANQGVNVDWVVVRKYAVVDPVLEFVGFDSLRLEYIIQYEQDVFESQDISLNLTVVFNGTEPTYLSGLSLWFDSSKINVNDENQVRNDSGTLYVKNWTDHSLNGFTAYQATEGYQPLLIEGFWGSNPAVRFVNDELVLPSGGDSVLSDDYTIFFVQNYTRGNGAYPAIFGNSDSSPEGWILDTSSVISHPYRFNLDLQTNSSDLYLPSIITMTSENGVESRLYRNGFLQDTSANTYRPSGTMRIGRGTGSATNFYIGYFYELIVYDRVLTDFEVDMVEDYLSQKYGLSVPRSEPVLKVTNFSTSLTFNGVEYNNTLITNNSTNFFFQKNVTIPFTYVNNSQINFSWYSIFDFTDNTSDEFQTQNFTQNISQAYILSSYNPSRVLEGQEFTVYLNVTKLVDTDVNFSGNVSLTHISAFENLGNLYGYWKFDERSGTTLPDESGNGRDGTLQNMEAGDWVPGLIKNALNFDGIDERVSMGTIGNFERTQNFSISFFMKTDHSYSGYAISKKDSGGDQTGWGIEVVTGKIRMHLRSEAGIEITVETVNNFTANEWTHVGMTYNGTSKADGVKLYVNGVEQEVTVISDTLTATIQVGKPFQISGNNGGNNVFKGLIDEAALWEGKVLNVSDMEYLYGFGYGRELEGPGINITTTYFNLIFENETLAQLSATVWTPQNNLTIESYNITYNLNISKNDQNIIRTTEDNLSSYMIDLKPNEYTAGYPCPLGYIDSVEFRTYQENDTTQNLTFIYYGIGNISTDHVSKNITLDNSVSSELQKICIAPNFGEFDTYARIPYTGTESPFTTSRDYILDRTLTNSSINISLYLSDTIGTDDWTLIALQGGNAVENAIIDIYRVVGFENILVTSTETNFEGKAIEKLYTDGPDYWFVIKVDGIVRKTTTPSKLIGDEHIITFNIEFGVDTTTLQQDYVSATCEIINLTYSQCYYTDTENFFDTFYMETVFFSIRNNSGFVCSDTSTLPTYTLNCNGLESKTGYGTFTTNLYAYKNGEQSLIYSTSEQRSQPGYHAIGTFLAAIFYIAIVFYLYEKTGNIVLAMAAAIIALVGISMSRIAILSQYIGLFAILGIISIWVILRGR